MFDYDAFLHANITQVFNERNHSLREDAMARLWTDAPSMIEAEDVLIGRDAISRHVAALHERLPAGTRFTPLAPAIGHHDTAILRWAAAIPEQDPHVFGTDLALIRDGRIDQLYVFLERR